MRRRLILEALEARHLLDAAGAALLVVRAEGEGNALPDFQLVDVNPASATAGESLSPRDYLEQVSAWYFGHAT